MAKLKPKIVFIDTEQFDAHKLSFSNPTFTRLQTLVEEGLVKVLLTEVVKSEVRRHIREEFKKAKNAVAKHYGGLFHNLKNTKVPPPLQDGYWIDAENEVAEQFKACCKRLKIETIPVQAKQVKTVFDWYFAIDGPFDSTKRKAEFPDAFSIAAIKDWAQKQRDQIHVISKDEAFRVVSREQLASSTLVRIRSLEEFFAMFPDQQVAAAIKVAFDKFLDEEEHYQFGEEEFQKLSFFVEDHENLAVTGVSMAFTQPYRVHVVEAKNGKAVVAGDVSIDFFPDIDGHFVDAQESALVWAEYQILYDEDDPSQIEVKAVRFEKDWALEVPLPTSYRRSS